MTNEEYDLLLAYPLDIKIAKTKQRIREWINYYGQDGVYISFSGGKDSSVLLDIVRSEYPNIKAVYCNTGLEYPEIKEAVKSYSNVEIIRPAKNFREIITDYGYPIVSKEQSHFIFEARNSKSEKLRNRRINGTAKGGFKISEKWKFLLEAPFRISHKCCYFMKKSPFKKYQKETNRVPILGTRAEECRLRRTEFILNGGCNSFKGNNPKSQPLSFWTEQDILNYIKLYNIKLPKIYGEIKEKDTQISFFNKDKDLFCTGAERTGCIFCGYGAHLESSPNRFEKLKKTHPAIYNYCIYGGGWDSQNMWTPTKEGLGFGFVLDYIGIRY